jgi:hypothetical protein
MADQGGSAPVCTADASGDAAALEAAAADLIAQAAALLGVPTEAVAALAREHWRPGDADAARRRLDELRDAHPQAAADARRAMAAATQPEALRLRIAELRASGAAHSKWKACELIAAELCKSVDYIDRRSRQRTHRDITLPRTV